VRRVGRPGFRGAGLFGVGATRAYHTLQAWSPYILCTSDRTGPPDFRNPTAAVFLAAIPPGSQTVGMFASKTTSRRLRASAFLMGMGGLAIFSSAIVSIAAVTEYVLVQKVLADDKAVIVRANGDTFLIEKGIGCLSLPRHEGKRVVIDSPGRFLGIGSRLLIPDVNQECRIRSSEEVSAAVAQVPTTRNSPRGADSGFELYDSRGNAAAYLELSEGMTFYLWDGDVAAYLSDDSVYGYNGKHLGWYRNGIVYDNEGAVVAAPATSFRGAVSLAPLKGLKSLKPLKGLRDLKPLKPLFGTSWSKVPAKVFFLLGID
jgi:hypothetical protein